MINNRTLPPENKGFIYGLFYKEQLFYIGQTKKSIQERYNRHVSKSYLYNERFTKKGKYVIDIMNNNELPEIDIIDIVDIENIDFYEIFYIGYFKSMGIELMNSTEGGLGGIFKNTKWKKTGRNFEFTPKPKYEKPDNDYFNFKKPKIIIQYDLQGHIINKFEGSSKASETTGIHNHLINQHCTSEKKYFKAKSKVDNQYYTFRYEDSPFDYHDWDKMQRHQKKLCRYDLDGNFLDTWISSIEASKSFDLKTTGINTTLNKEGKYRITAKSIFLKEGEIFDITKVPTIIRGILKKVNKLDDDMNIISSYVSINKAGESNNLPPDGLSRFLKRNPNKTKKYHGFYWEVV